MMWQSVGNSDKSQLNWPCRDILARVAIAKHPFARMSCLDNTLAAMMPKHLMK